MREHHTDIIGTKATAVLAGEHDHTRLRISREGQDGKKKKPASVGPIHFFECLRSGVPSRATIRDSIPSLKAALAMQKASKSGRTVELSGFGS